MRETLSRSTTMKSFSEYLVKTSTQKSTLGWIAAGRGNGSLVSDDALGAAANTSAIAIAIGAIPLTIRFPDSFATNNDVSIARESPSARFHPAPHKRPPASNYKAGSRIISDSPSRHQIPFRGPTP